MGVVVENNAFIQLFLLTFCVICDIILAICVIYLFIQHKAVQLSTHKLEYIPFEPEMAHADKKVAELNENFESGSMPFDEEEFESRKSLI
jgi:hypothetical protein